MKFTAGSLSTLVLTLFFVHYNWLASWMGVPLIIFSIIAAIGMIIFIGLTIIDEFEEKWD